MLSIEELYISLCIVQLLISWWCSGDYGMTKNNYSYNVEIFSICIGGSLENQNCPIYILGYQL